jgi:Ca2+ transporting ATPase
MTGQGKGLVCAVGDCTLLAKSRKPEDLTIQEQQTDLERKLEKCANQISKYAMFATILSVISHLIFQVIVVMFTESKTFFSNDFLLELLKIGIIAVVLMIVAIPEGLPLAVSIAMALSITRLKNDEILIKNLESI